MSTETLQTICQTAVALGLLLTALGGYGAYHFGQRLQREKDVVAAEQKKNEAAKSAYTGVLTAQRKVLFSVESKVFPEMEFGDSGAVLVFAGPQGTPFLTFAEDNELIIATDAKGIKVSTTIRNRNGRVVAELSQNEWKVNPNDTWDRNYSENALEVKDDTGDIVLQVRLVENRVQLQAKFYDSTGGGVALGKAEGPEGGGMIELTGANHPKLTLKIEPLFKYPSALHLGEFREYGEPATPNKSLQPMPR